MLVFDSGRNDLPIFLRSNDVDLDVLHDEIKLNEVANLNRLSKTTKDCVFHLLVTNHNWVLKIISGIKNKYCLAHY